MPFHLHNMHTIPLSSDIATITCFDFLDSLNETLEQLKSIESSLRDQYSKDLRVAVAEIKLIIGTSDLSELVEAHHRSWCHNAGVVTGEWKKWSQIEKAHQSFKWIWQVLPDRYEEPTRTAIPKSMMDERILREYERATEFFDQLEKEEYKKTVPTYYGTSTAIAELLVREKLDASLERNINNSVSHIDTLTTHVDELMAGNYDTLYVSSQTMKQLSDATKFIALREKDEV